MRRSIATALTACVAGGAAVIALALPAAAINSYNAETAPERTEVGTVIVMWDSDGDGSLDTFDWYCSGTMVDVDTFLTAAHCTSGWGEGARFFVSLEQDVQSLLDDSRDLTAAKRADLFLDEGWAVEGDPHQDPAFPGSSSDSHDIAVIDFADRQVTPQDVWTFTPATLPTADQLSDLGGRALDAAEWWAVGYGTEEAVRGPGGHVHPGGGVRMKAMEDFNALNKTWVRLAMNESRGLGGACYGDSGGPNFVVLDGEWVLASTTITGDVPCYATNVTYRLDTAGARAFLDDFVDLP